MNVIKEAPGAH